MVSIKRSSLKASIAVALTLELAISVGAQVQAQSRPVSPSSIPANWKPQEYQPPSGIGSPGKREGGATRDGCLNKTKNPEDTLTALEPKSTFVATVSPYPTLFWYWPHTSDPAKSVSMKFVLMDGKNKEIYTKELPVPRTPGIVSLDLSAFKANLSPLEIGKGYHWELIPICKASGYPIGTYYVNGWLQRLEPNPALARKIQQARTPQQRFALYANAGYWNETLTALAELRRLQPNNPTLVDTWKKLLESVGLNQILEEPLVKSTAKGDSFSGNSSNNN